MSSPTNQALKRRALLKCELYREQNPNPELWLTRQQVRERLMLADGPMRQLEKRGILNIERRNSAGYGLYAAAVVAHVEAKLKEGAYRGIHEKKLTPKRPPPSFGRYQANEAREVFKMIEKGIPLTTIVVETGLHPLAVKSIVQQYESFSGAIMVPGNILKKMNSVRLSGRFPLTTGADILELLQGLEDEQLCTTCMQSSAARECARCILLEHAKHRARTAAASKQSSTPPSEEGPQAAAVISEGETAAGRKRSQRAPRESSASETRVPDQDPKTASEQRHDIAAQRGPAHRDAAP